MVQSFSEDSSPFTRTNLEKCIIFAFWKLLAEIFTRFPVLCVKLNPAKIYGPYQKYKIALASSDLKLLQT